MKDIHPVNKECTYKCVTCNSEFVISSASKNLEVSIEVCSKCHPFYIGKQNTATALRGRAEKLSTKFETGLSNANNKPARKEVVRKQKPKNGLDSL